MPFGQDGIRIERGAGSPGSEQKDCNDHSHARLLHAHFDRNQATAEIAVNGSPKASAWRSPTSLSQRRKHNESAGRRGGDRRGDAETDHQFFKIAHRSPFGR